MTQSRPSTDNRRISQLRQLSLVTFDDYDLIPSETQELHGKYTSVSATLNYIKLWREYKQKEESENPRSSHIHYLLGQSPYGKRTSKLLSYILNRKQTMLVSH